jgi:murein DD-endopeptidase MepM/ murein hydrolase activator NlpD
MFPTFFATFLSRRRSVVAVLIAGAMVVGSPAAAQDVSLPDDTTTTTLPALPPPPSTTLPANPSTSTTLPPSPPTTPPAPPTAAPPVAPPPSLPPNPELDGLRDRRVNNTDRLWSLQYSDAELEMWATALNQIVVEKQSNVNALRGDLLRSQIEVLRLGGVIAGIEKEVAALESVVRGRVVEAYMVAGSHHAAAGALLQSTTPVDLEFRQFLVSIANESDREVLDRLSERKSAARDEKRRAETKEQEITQLKEEADRELADLASVKADLDALRTALDARAGDIRKEIAALAAEESFLRKILGYPDETTGSPASVVRPVSAEGLIWPVEGVLTSVFGMRWGALHAGIDVGAPTGTPIYASSDGTVIFSGSQGGYGNIVIIDHGYGFHTAYAHMSRTVAVNGSRVLRGELIGLVGSTGNSTGPHLHFETRVFGKAYDPLQYLPKR